MDINFWEFLLLIFLGAAALETISSIFTMKYKRGGEKKRTPNGHPMPKPKTTPPPMPKPTTEKKSNWEEI